MSGLFLRGVEIEEGFFYVSGFFELAGAVEKAREFDPFGHAGLTPSGIIRLTPSGKIKMTPVDDTAGEFFCSFENPCPGTAGFNVKYYKI
ncbi:hypothetical protein EEL39_15870 [Muribaculaceae bacterium Isolate-080 (Janvier)]|jgi:hypothetical protein|nr:hypothetical protein EEL39_15870 [Muribaculaceae bacterium Isolate-080 (Janvier)]